jgi:uncharacterized protein YyaL (SSP411 family)
VVLPSAREAAAWFVDTARAAVASGERLDAEAVRLLIALAPGDPILVAAIDAVEPSALELETVAAKAREATAQLRDAVAARDENRARETVTALELEVLRAYHPRAGLGRFEDDVAVALAMLAAHDVGGDEAHLMMAEELMLGAMRRYGADRDRHSLAVNCDAALALAALAGRTGKSEYHERALEIVRAFADSYRGLGVRAAPYISALQMIG